VANQNTCILAGNVYDAVEVSVTLAALGCDGCDLKGQTDLCRSAPPCMPGDNGRVDGRFIVFKRRITNTPVEASSQRLRDAEILERMNREHVG
jgi:hypothetical protein